MKKLAPGHLFKKIIVTEDTYSAEAINPALINFQYFP